MALGLRPVQGLRGHTDRRTQQNAAAFPPLCPPLSWEQLLPAALRNLGMGLITPPPLWDCAQHGLSCPGVALGVSSKGPALPLGPRGPVNEATPPDELPVVRGLQGEGARLAGRKMSDAQCGWPLFPRTLPGRTCPPGPIPSRTHVLLSVLSLLLSTERRGPQLLETTQLVGNVGLHSALNLLYNLFMSFIWSLQLL